MKIEYVKISDLENNPRNPKIHPDRQVRLIEKSIERFGWTNPIILSEDGLILAGHARVKAAIEKGMVEVPCIRTKLSGDDADAYLIADNHIAELAPYDQDILADLLSDLPADLAELTGFENVEINSLLDGDEAQNSTRFLSSHTDEQPPKDPKFDSHQVTESEMEKAQGNIDIGMSTTLKQIDTICPECGYEFSIGG